MAYTAVNKSTDYFETKLWTGNETDNRDITGLNFQPDFAWIKARSQNYGHSLFDAVRGVNKYLCTNSTTAEIDQPSSGYISQFNSDGYRLKHGSSTFRNVNDGDNSTTYVSYNWKANGAGSANTDGATASTVSVNNTAGFSIVKWTGTSGNTTVGHGMNTAPVFTIVKDLGNSGSNWVVYHKDISPDYAIKLNTTDTQSNSNNYWQSTAPTNSLLTFTGSTASNGNGNNMIAYCFAEKTGYSKFGSYTGNGASGTNPNVDGSFVYTGFKPKWILIKHASGGTASGEHWNLQDVKRSTYNPSIVMLSPNQSSADNSTNNNGIDFLSNGFKIRNNDGRLNNSGATYIYAAFGQSLVGSNNVPCTAR